MNCVLTTTHIVGRGYSVPRWCSASSAGVQRTDAGAVDARSPGAPVGVVRRIRPDRSTPSARPYVRSGLTREDNINIFLSVMSDEQLVEAFQALSDVHRLRALQFIAGDAPPGAGPEDSVCACHVQDHLDLSQPATSYHLKVLRQAGLVESEKRGRWVHYRISADGLDALKTFLDDIEEAGRAGSGAVA